MRDVVAIDTETHLIEPGLLAPPLICLSYATKHESGLLGRNQAIAYMKRLFWNETPIVGHNIAYDLAVLMKQAPEITKLIFDHYHKGLVQDTQVREMLFCIREGTFTANRKKFSLNALSKKYRNIELNKSEDSWRYRYKELEDIPIRDWPEEARYYAIEDAKATYSVFREQENSPDEQHQTRAAWGLHLMSVRGIEVDRRAVDELEKTLKTEVKRYLKDLIALGLIRESKLPNKPTYAKARAIAFKKMRKLGKFEEEKVAREQYEAELRSRLVKYEERLKRGVIYTKDTKAIERRVLQSLKPEQLEKTATGRLQIDTNALEKTKDPELHKLVEYKANEKLLTTYIPLLKQKAINPRFNVLVETGRTSCSSPNLQNQPRKPGVRECFVPRDGYVFVACDYDTAELRALAQVCYSWLGESKMREAFIEDRDPHLELATDLLGITYEEAVRRKKDTDVKGARQFAKIANFGFPGGLGVDAFMRYANGFGYEISQDFAYELRSAWFRKWPEMHRYFERAAFVSDEFGSKRVIQLESNRIRGKVRFTQAANTPFQGLVADGAKEAVFRVQRECYVDRGTALFGCFPVVFVHDEIIAEVPEQTASEAADRLSKVMNESMQEWIPDVPIKSSAHLMRYWTKEAEEIRDEHGRLLIWGD